MKQRLNSSVPLQTIVEFLLQTGPVILCFDNVDRFSFEAQRYVLETCLDISNESEIAVILAIREANLRRMTPSGALGDITFIENMRGRVTKNVSVRDFRSLSSSSQEKTKGDISTEELLAKRIDFVRQHEEFAPLGEYFNYLNDKYQIGLSVQEYMERFWDVFRIISRTFVDGHAYSYCNFSIRKILIMYVGFISKLLLDADPGYTLDEILTEKRHARVTKLRNYFYKWLVCSDAPLPSDQRNLINIFQTMTISQEGLSNLDYKILAYLYNQKAFESNSAVTLKQIADDLSVFGIRKSSVANRLVRLTENQDFEEETLIWGEASDNTKEKRFTSYMLMPAGKYFIEKLCVSREYAFWNVLDADLSDEMLPQLIKSKSISYLDTFSDRFKLDFVYDYVRLALYPQLLRELQSMEINSNSLSTTNRFRIHRYWRLFSINGHLYEVLLLDSVMGTIDHSFLEYSQRKTYRDKYLDLINLLKDTERRYRPEKP
jgi:hypothetical protein